jgi:uncharacterized membrane protein
MDILQFNISWMVFNLFLALLPVLFVWLFFQVRNKTAKIVLGFFWFLFLPNTIYVITDLEHLVTQWPHVDSLAKIFLVGQYAAFEVIGLSAFFITLYPFEAILRRKKFSHDLRVFILVLLNFFFGVAMVLGKVDRIHSAYLFTNPLFVFRSILHVFSSFELLWLSILLGLFSNCIYFLFREVVIEKYKQSKFKSHFFFLHDKHPKIK